VTASELFAGRKHNHGDHNCYYCGASCDEQYKTADYVKDTFTNRDIVKYPQSKYVCIGCVESLGNGEDEMPYIDGTTKVRENARGMCPRMYSWILFPDHKLAGTKAHMKEWREILLNPPDPPFAIILAESGQKQLIFRAPIAMDKACFSILLEDEAIEVIPELLKERIEMCTPICAALGKPALEGDISFSSYTRYQEYYGEIESFEKWLAIRSEPLSRLAAWLSKSKEDAQNEYPNIECGKVSAGAGRTGGQKSGASGNGAVSNQGRGGQVLFDLG
jgi:hypothetical protein